MRWAVNARLRRIRTIGFFLVFVNRQKGGVISECNRCIG